MESSISRNSHADPGEIEAQAKIRARAASVALIAAFVLMAMKVGIGLWSRSVGLFSEGIHSGLDLVSAAVAFFTIREAGKPADDDHPFGHGKIETLSSLLESFLLVAAAGFIVAEGVKHFRNPEPIEHTGYAIATIAASLVISYFVYLHNVRAATRTESSAIQVNALHFLADAITAAGVLVALIAIHFTGALWLDPAIAFLIAIYILGISWRQIVQSIRELTDRMLPEEEVERARAVFASFRPRILDVHDLRTRKSGAHRHFDCHAIVCGHLSVRDSHAICDEMEEALEREFPGSLISIHMEPCGHPGTARPPHCDRTKDGKCDGGRARPL